MENGETNLEAEQRFSRMASSIAKAHVKSMELEGNFIHPTAIIGENVKMGKNNFIGANCIITGNTSIGNNNTFVAFCSIGLEPEHRDYFDKENKGLVIGDRNYFREFVTINAGCLKPTIIEDDVVVFRGSHIGHDSVIMRNATLSHNVSISGHSVVGIFSKIGTGSICYLYSKIGHYSMIGANSTISKGSDVGCFETWVGSPAGYLKDNAYWMQNFTDDDVIRIRKEFNQEKL